MPYVASDLSSRQTTTTSKRDAMSTSRRSSAGRRSFAPLARGPSNRCWSYRGLMIGGQRPSNVGLGEDRGAVAFGRVW